MRKSKNRYFYHIFDSPGDAPGAITLNVVWMERDFDAYKLSRCMCPSIYNGLWDRARYFWKKIVILSYPLAFDAPVRGVPVGMSAPLWYGKLECCRYPTVEKFRRYVYSFWCDLRTWLTDRRTDRQTLHDSIDRPCIASCGKNVVCKRKKFAFNTFLNFKPVKRS